MIAIVVLGAPLASGDRLSTVLVERVEATLALHRTLTVPHVIVATGGITRGAGRAEADVIAEALRARGLAVLVEDRALTTEDNATFSAALLAPLGIREVVLVTQPFHARRAVWLFREAGLVARAHPMPDSVQYRDRWRAFRWTVRECAAWGKLVATRVRRRLTASAGSR